jgi:hypothetical protein
MVQQKAGKNIPLVTLLILKRNFEEVEYFHISDTNMGEKTP